MISRTLLTDRRLHLLVVVCLTALAAGRFLVPDLVALNAVIKAGYWILLGTLIWWSRVVWTWLREERAAGGRRWVGDRPSWGVAALVVAVGAVWQVQETHGYKILADEVLLAGTAQGMHLDRDVTYPVRATDVHGPFVVLQGVLDKRPYLFPLVVSLVHDFTGYRTSNAFWVNTVLGFVFLALLYLLCAKAAGDRRGGVLAVALAAGLPLLAQQAAGGGFELLNLTLMAGWWLAAMQHLQRPTASRQDLMVMTAVLLASTRYESMLFLLPTALLVWVGWVRGRALICTPASWVAPLLMVPMLWLNRAFAADASRWEMQSMGAERPFGLEYVPDNLGHALSYFFTLDGFQPNAPLLGLLGLLALPVFLLWAQRVWRSAGREDGEAVGLALGALGGLAVTGLMMVYFWGQFDHPVIRRLSLPTQLLMLVAIATVAGRVLRLRPPAWTGLFIAAAAVYVAHGLPTMAKNAYGREYMPGVAFAWRQEFLASRPERDFLMLDRDSIFWITERVASTPTPQAQARRDGLAFHLRNQSFSAVYIYQTFVVDAETGSLTLEAGDDPGPGFELETVMEKRVHLLRLARISRVTAITNDGGETARAGFSQPRADAPALSEAEQREITTRYLERWVRELP